MRNSRIVTVPSAEVYSGAVGRYCSIDFLPDAEQLSMIESLIFSVMSSCGLDSQYQWHGTWFESVLSLDMVHWRYERQLTPPAAKRGESISIWM